MLQGPPGTGKSQTITNMIAECLLAGRKVLFVAEKGTALSVVQRRLDAVGLGPFTLNLHHDGSTATQVRAQLKAALTTRVAPDPAAMESAQRKLRNARYELGEFPEKLHRRNAAGLSAYSARDNLLVLGDGPAVEVPRDLIAARAELVGEVRDALTRLQPLAGAAGARVGHPWRLAGRAPEGELDVEKASSVVRTVVEAAQWAKTTTGPLRALLDGISEPAQFGRLAALSNPALPSGDVLRAVLETHWSAATSTAIAGAENAVREWLPSLRGFAPDVLEIDLQGVAEELRQAKESSIFGRSKRQEAAARRLQPYAPGAVELTPVAAEQALPSLIAAQQTGAAIFANISALPGIDVAAGWNPFRAGAFESVHAQFDALVKLTASARVTGTWDDAARAAAIAGELDGESARLVELAANWTALWTAVGATQADAAAWARGASLLEAVRSHGDTWLRHADHERLIPLQRWLALVAALQPLASAGLVSTREEILDGRIRVDELEDAFDRGVAQASLTERVVVEGLDRFDSRAHDERVRTYAVAEGDVRREWVTAGPSQLLTSRGGGGAGLKTGGLARELEKTRQRLGTRAILRRYGDAVQELTPLVLCSPASAVDLIEPGVMEFDLVIFDEASQITVPEAIGAIARARAVVVVGDSKQMPPSRRVGTQTAAEEEFDDSGDEEIVEDQESILSECELARVPTLSLSWHYRSQDEALIAFSNRAYYDGGLSSFPTPSLLSSTTGVQFVPVDGQFIRTSSRDTVDMGRGVVAGKGTNPVEARAVVDTVASLLAAENAPTIGIVTFNEQQRLLIEDLLRAYDDPNINAAMDENAMGPSDVLFIKALEQVQGDERDVVLFSVAFSKQGERIPLNFGPLSNSGGERRLNVAVTRARLKNMVFCSFDPEQLDADSASFRGVKDLKDFLRFAKASAGLDATQATDRTPIRDRHRDEVAAALRDAGLHVRVDVGMSDFRLDLVLSREDQPDRPVLPVLLDGESWRSRHTVADRDVLPVEVLTGLMGWPSVARVWWPMWLQNRDEVIARLLEEFDAADAALVERPEESIIAADSPVGALGASAPAGAPTEMELSPLRSESPIAAVPPAVADDAPVYGWAPAAPATAAEPVEAAVTDELSAPVVPVTPINPVVADHTDPMRSDDVPGARDGVRVFVPAPSVSAGSRETLDHLSERRPAAAVREQLLDIIEAEGPIEVGRLIRLTARRFDLLKVRAAREEEIRRLIPRGVIRKSRLGDFAWPERLDPETWQGYRLPDEPPSRGLDEVAPEELLNAMRSIVSDAPGIDDESAIRATARLFGISKLGALVRARLEAVAAKLRLESGE
ncbi:AAA domain-containing protein [Microbacterium aurantiacum]|uniref:AAA domain-containing protein n=1 Tax=Microbacterium aurantiacum TaxID=162393 RepID=UPI0012E77090|nr:AAA domain-containing protein [Microbacterium chocolatum]